MRAFLFGMGHFLPIKFPNATAVAIPDESGQVTGNEFCHFKHGDLRFTTENGFQLVICIDIAFVFWCLQVMLFDVFPYFFVTSVRGIGAAPITAASVGEIVIGFMNAAFGLRSAAGLAAAFFGAAAGFAAGFFAAVAINSLLHNFVDGALIVLKSSCIASLHASPIVVRFPR
jgi:hypothetical protein